MKMQELNLSDPTSNDGVADNYLQVATVPTNCPDLIQTANMEYMRHTLIDTDEFSNFVLMRETEKDNTLLVSKESPVALLDLYFDTVDDIKNNVLLSEDYKGYVMELWRNKKESIERTWASIFYEADIAGKDSWRDLWGSPLEELTDVLWDKNPEAFAVQKGSNIVCYTSKAAESLVRNTDPKSLLTALVE